MYRDVIGSLCISLFQTQFNYFKPYTFILDLHIIISRAFANANYCMHCIEINQMGWDEVL